MIEQYSPGWDNFDRYRIYLFWGDDGLKVVDGNSGGTVLISHRISISLGEILRAVESYEKSSHE